MSDVDRTTWTLAQIADEVIEVCELPMGCRATLIAALGDAKNHGRIEGHAEVYAENAALREELIICTNERDRAEDAVDAMYARACGAKGESNQGGV